MLNKLISAATIVCFARLVAAASEIRSTTSSWDFAGLETLVVFGDSYSDDYRLGYFIYHGGSAPPVGWVNPANYHSAVGGRVWPQYVAQYSGAKLLNYATSGAECSNSITPRFYSTINGYFPTVAEYEVPAWLADSTSNNFQNQSANTTAYAFWIGGNDLGAYGFITNSELPGTSIMTYLDCVYDSVQRVYNAGGRFFVLMNVAPLNLAPLYGLPEAGGVGTNASHYWPDKGSDLTDISYRMKDMVENVNSLYYFRTPFATKIAKRFPGARFAVYDVHGLFMDIYNNPSQYLNGTGAPLNVTGYAHHCDAADQNCVTSSSPDSFLWYDELHPSEQTGRIIASNFVNVVKGTSKYASYWSD